jgi:hypothetical protein
MKKLSTKKRSLKKTVQPKRKQPDIGAAKKKIDYAEREKEVARELFGTDFDGIPPGKI